MFLEKLDLVKVLHRLQQSPNQTLKVEVRVGESHFEPHDSMISPSQYACTGESKATSTNF